MSLTTDKNDPALKREKSNGQNEAYLVLPAEELAKGFVRPYRDAYVHVGRKLDYKNIHKILTEEEKKEYTHKSYVAVMTILTKEDGSFLGGTYVTQDELMAWEKGERFGGCGTLTTMNRTISETYARNPKFYGATFCCGCGRHLPVNEFFWANTEIEVGE